jgi:hypothetical protein
VRFISVREEDLMKLNITAPPAAQLLPVGLVVMLLAGCGSGAATLAADPASAPTTSSATKPEPAATSPATTVAGSPVAMTPTETETGDVAAAVQSALALFAKVPRNPNDVTAGYYWGPAVDTTGHLSPDVTARLTALRRDGYFSDRVCAEDYLTGTQNGLPAAPTVVSAHRETAGTVAVVIRRPATPKPPDLTVVMTRRNGTWLATDLASGSGPSASIFAAKPHC